MPLLASLPMRGCPNDALSARILLEANMSPSHIGAGVQFSPALLASKAEETERTLFTFGTANDEEIKTAIGSLLLKPTSHLYASYVPSVDAPSSVATFLDIGSPSLGSVAPPCTPDATFAATPNLRPVFSDMGTPSMATDSVTSSPSSDRLLTPPPFELVAPPPSPVDGKKLAAKLDFGAHLEPITVYHVQIKDEQLEDAWEVIVRPPNVDHRTPSPLEEGEPTALRAPQKDAPAAPKSPVPAAPKVVRQASPRPVPVSYPQYADNRMAFPPPTNGVDFDYFSGVHDAVFNPAFPVHPMHPAEYFNMPWGAPFPPPLMGHHMPTPPFPHAVPFHTAPLPATPYHHGWDAQFDQAAWEHQQWLQHQHQAQLAFNQHQQHHFQQHHPHFPAPIPSPPESGHPSSISSDSPRHHEQQQRHVSMSNAPPNLQGDQFPPLRHQGRNTLPRGVRNMRPPAGPPRKPMPFKPHGPARAFPGRQVSMPAVQTK